MKFSAYFWLCFLLIGCHPSLSQPTQTAIIPEAFETATPVSTSTLSVQPFPTATSTSLPATSSTSTNIPNLSATDYSMVFLNETIPDETIFQPGETFQKTWTLQNDGPATWGAKFALAVSDSIPSTENLDSPIATPLSKEVQRGESITIRVDLKVPLQEGQYTVYYHLQDEEGTAIPNTQIWVTINVCKSKDSCSATNSTGSTSVNGIDVSLNSFTYDDQHATVIFCMNYPNRNYALDYAPVLLLDQRPALFLEGGSSYPWNCMQMIYQVGSNEIKQADHIVLDIGASLRMSPPYGDPNAACETARQSLVCQYPGLNFQCQFSMAGYYTSLKIPSNLTREQADILIRDTIEGAIYGPWQIKIR